MLQTAVGALVAGADRIAQAEKVLDTVTICPNRIGQAAALFGLEQLSGWADDQRAEIARRRDALAGFIAERVPEWRIAGLGAYFAWVEPPFGLPARSVARRLVTEQSVLALPGDMFLPEGTPTTALRIAFANADVAGLDALTLRLARFTG